MRKKKINESQKLLQQMQIDIDKARIADEEQTLTDLSAYFRYCMDGKPRNNKIPPNAVVYDYSNRNDGCYHPTTIVGMRARARDIINKRRKKWWYKVKTFIKSFF